jgi:hypothetical protein
MVAGNDFQPVRNALLACNLEMQEKCGIEADHIFDETVPEILAISRNRS